MKKGMIDPLKVVRTALENTSSVAVMILTTEALVADIPERDEVPRPAMLLSTKPQGAKCKLGGGFSSETAPLR